MENKLAEFYAEITSDENLKATLEKILAGKNITEVTDAQLKEIGEIAKDLGYNFTIKEFKDFINFGDVQLSEDELAAVAGGVNKDPRMREGTKNNPEERGLL